MQGRSHDDTGFSRVWSLVLLALISVKHLVVGGAISVAVVCVPLLLHLFVRRLFLCWFVQHDRRSRHVSFSWSGEMSCLRTWFFLW